MEKKFRERKNLGKRHNGANSFQRGFYLLHLLTGDKLSRMAFFALFSSKKCSCCCKKKLVLFPRKKVSLRPQCLFSRQLIVSQARESEWCESFAGKHVCSPLREKCRHWRWSKGGFSLGLICFSTFLLLLHTHY